MSVTVTIEDIRRAASVIDGHVVRTPAVAVPRRRAPRRSC